MKVGKYLKQNMKNVFRCMFLTKTTAKIVSHPGLVKKVKEAVRKTHVLFRRYRRMKAYIDKLAYNYQRNIIDNVVSKAKRDYESKIMKSVKTEPKRFYSYVKSKQKVNMKVPSLQRPDGTMTNNDNENCRVLGDFFSSVFTKEHEGNDLPQFESRCEDSLNNVNISEEIVFKNLKCIKVDKSQGPDGLNLRLLKECSSSIVKPLFIIFKKSLETATLPEDFKQGNRNNPENYRPVSVTSIPCKILESLIRDSMVKHLKTNRLIAKEQHGFVKGRSCLTNLLETCDGWMDDLRFYVLFNSISDISGRCSDDNERLYAMELHLRLRRFRLK